MTEKTDRKTPAERAHRAKERKEEGAHSPAAVWGNPKAAPDARKRGDVGEEMARERRPREEDEDQR